MINGLAIDLVVVNLYPFEEKSIKNSVSLDKLIEYIDIGGPSMLRASAKNYNSVITICSPNQYNDFTLNSTALTTASSFAPPPPV